jgi:Metallo-peptidase family M12B Reprolysin-like
MRVQLLGAISFAFFSLTGQIWADPLLLPASNAHEGQVSFRSVDPSIFNMSEGDRVTLPELGGQIYQAELVRIETQSLGGQLWVGQIVGGERGHRVILTAGSDAVFGLFITPTGSWTLAPASPGGLLAISPASAPPDEPTSDGLNITHDRIRHAARQIEPALNTQIAENVAAGSLGNIDIAVIYTEGMRSYYGLGVITRVQHLVNALDQALVDSDTGLRARLVHAALVPVPWVETTSTIETIDDLVAGASIGSSGTSADVFGSCETGFGLQCNNDGDLSSLFALRNGVSADIVVMVRRYWRAQQTYCGVAYLPGSGEGIIDPGEDHILGVGVVGDGPDGNGTGFNCGDLTFAHEVGHNLGSTHNIENSSAPGVLPDSYGHRVDCGFRTIMAYDSTRSNVTCAGNTPVRQPNESWIAMFSNPALVNCQGQACGVANGGSHLPGSPTDDTTTPTDNARSMREQGLNVRLYRDPEAPQIRSAILPYSRTVQFGQTATAFVSIVNPAASGSTATRCGLTLHGARDGEFTYQTTDPNSNAVTGVINTPTDIPAGSAQSYVISLNRPAMLAEADLRIDAQCNNRRAAPVVSGVNTFRFFSTLLNLADIVALSATVGNTGYVDLPSSNGSGAFSVATSNLGALSNVVVSASPASTAQEMGAVEVCRTDPVTSVCQTPRAASLTQLFQAGETLTFAVFVRGTGQIDNDPANNRIFVNFRSPGGQSVGATSVAVRTTQP